MVNMLYAYYTSIAARFPHAFSPLYSTLSLVLSSGMPQSGPKSMMGSVFQLSTFARMSGESGAVSRRLYLLLAADRFCGTGCAFAARAGRKRRSVKFLVRSRRHCARGCSLLWPNPSSACRRPVSEWYLICHRIFFAGLGRRQGISLACLSSHSSQWLAMRFGRRSNAWRSGACGAVLLLGRSEPMTGYCGVCRSQRETGQTLARFAYRRRGGNSNPSPGFGLSIESQPRQCGCSSVAAAWRLPNSHPF